MGGEISDRLGTVEVDEGGNTLERVNTREVRVWGMGGGRLEQSLSLGLKISFG